MQSAPERLLRRLEWRVLRRLDGQLQGGHRTAYRGSGVDVTGVREYTPEDDARHIDWNVTARLDAPHIRLYAEDRELTAWLVLDRSASMSFRADGHGKDAVLTELAVSLAGVFSSGGDRVGAIMYDDTSRTIVPPRGGRRHILRITAMLLRATPSGRPGATTDIAGMLRLAATTIRRRSLVFVISDFIGDPSWERELNQLAHRHEVVVIRVEDPLETELPELGTVFVEDAETGEQLLIDVSDPLFRTRFRAAAATRAEQLEDAMRHAGVIWQVVSTTDDIVPALVDLVRSSQRRRA